MSNERVLRGGSWCHRAGLCTRAFRESCLPAGDHNYIGLRLACSVHTARNPVGAGEVILGISPYEKDIHIMAVTADGLPIQVEGCTDTELPSGEECFLTATGNTVVLKGIITKLDCGGNQLISLDIRGLTALRELYCWDNQLTTLNLKDLPALEVLRCEDNQLTLLNVKDVTSLQFITCNNNRLTSLDIQGVNSLSKLYCYRNRLKEQAFIRILNNLPNHKSDEKGEAVFYTEEEDQQPEENSMDVTSSADLKAAMESAMKKNWILYKQDGEGDFEEIEFTE